MSIDIELIDANFKAKHPEEVKRRKPQGGDSHKKDQVDDQITSVITFQTHKRKLTQHKDAAANYGHSF